MGFFGFSNAMRRKAIKEESRAEDTYLYNIGKEDERLAKRELKEARFKAKESKKIYEKRVAPINTAIGYAFSSKRPYGIKPKKFKSTATRGIYSSPFRR